MTVADTEIAIVGGGPVGLGLAIELGQRGIACTIIERHEQPQPIPRGQNLTQRTMEHMHFWGAEQQLRAARTIPPEYGIGGMTAYGTLLSDYTYDWMQRELVRSFYLTDNERLPQYATEAVLRARAAELDKVRTLFGWRAESLTQHDHGATVTASAQPGGDRLTLHSRYVVGCDGARSLVRETAGIAQTRSDHDRRMVLLVFRSTGLHELLRRYPGKSFYSVLSPELEGYWKFFGRVDLGNIWFFHAPVPQGATAGNADFNALMHGAVGAPFDVELLHVGFWDLRFAVADTYRSFRLFIAGDAAHSHPPYGGYGINMGFEDARNLGWKLAATLQGWGGDPLLDSYSAERQPVFKSLADDFIEKSIQQDRDFLAAFDPERDRAAFEARWNERKTGARAEVAAFEPNYEGSPIVLGPPGGVSSAKGRHLAVARPGHHLAPVTLASGRSTFATLGRGFTLFAFATDPHPIAAAAEAARVPLSVIAEPDEQARATYGAGLILVRPDQFVAWTGDAAPKDPAALIARASGLTTRL